MTVVLHWDGNAFPEELRALPKGRYVVTPLDQAIELTAAEEEGLGEALDSLDRGEGVDIGTVRSDLDQRIYDQRLRPITK